MTRRRRIATAAPATLALALIVAAATTGALPLWSNDAPEVGVDAYFEEGVGDVSNLSAQSDILVVGDVEEVGSGRWREGVSTVPRDRNLLNVYHPVRIEVDRARALKPGVTSPGEGSTISVRVLGGRVNDTTAAGVTDASHFEEGERTLVFLNGEGDHYLVSGLKHGKFTVRGKTALRLRVGPQYRKEIPVQEIVDATRRRKGRPTEPGR